MTAYKNWKISEEKLKSIVQNYGGECLFEEYSGLNVSCLFKCKVGHQFILRPGHIIYEGSWCKYCNKLSFLNKTKIQLELVVNQRGGKIIDLDYKGIHYKYEFECVFKHRFIATASHILHSGSWCNICAGYLMERICRKYFELIFNSNFKSHYPEWLINNNGYRLQLDGYNEKLKIAFEYNGVQHFKEHGFFDDGLSKRQEHDELKKQLCIKNNVTLVVISEIKNKKYLKDLIIERCQLMGIKLPEDINNRSFDISGAYLPEDIERLERLKKIVLEKNGELLSNYSGTKNKVKIKCNVCIHIWEPIYDSIVSSGTWCPMCWNARRGESLKGITRSHKCSICRQIGHNSRNCSFKKTVYETN